MKTVVTGGGGFIGSHLVEALLREGHEVRVLDREGQYVQRGAEYLDADITDFAAVLSATKGYDYIYHLAAISNVNHAYDDPLRTVRVNSLGTVHMLEAARRNGAKRLFFASTVWVYTGAVGDSIDENSPFFIPQAGHIYTSTKIAGELYCQNYIQMYKTPVTVLRYGIPYGPRMRRELVMARFIERALRGEPLTITGDGSQYRNFLYIDDLIGAHLLATRDEAANQVYNLEGLHPITVREMAEAIQRAVSDVRIEYAPARPGDFRGRTCSAEKARRELGWVPRVELEEGLRKTIEWFRSEGAERRA